ncbi:ATP-binding protein [Infirmifilum lucidum]|uniref:ATP-binding protein n=1 Tax=Infirmifilum lucidum TaxID=2776706 RepID=A0A7L9FGR4_9CREN|nr:ATP-binding protein [Infirmifilum lucidum]QOJ79000.1 ATP-binding protein [Infirmifilum lucidum]
MAGRFIDREEELEYLERLYREGRPHMVVLYGRRRIGKTELAKKFIEGKKSVYFHAVRQDLRLEAERLARVVSRALGTYVEPDFEEVFSRLAEQGRVVVVIDEFTHWVEEDPRILTVLQRVWDEYLAQSRVFLLLVASAATLVEKSFSYGSALYGRRTGQWKLGELEPRFVRDFLPNYSLEELVAVYGCVGGVPFYLSLFDPSRSLEENINALFFSKGGVLYEEAENLLRYELREPYTYFNIVRAIEEGATSYSEIADKARVSVTTLPKYLHVLEKMGVVERVKPVLGRARPVYAVRDNYLRFWVRYVLPNKDRVELGAYRFRLQEMWDYLPLVFEEMVRRSLKHLWRKGVLPFLGTCGKYWERDLEVDVLCLEGEKVLALEVKWAELDAGEARETVQELRRKLGYREGYYGVVAKKIHGYFEGLKVELADLF